MSPAEMKYFATEQECLAVWWGLKQFRQYLYGRPCIVYTDHQALKWLLSIKDPTGRLCRWSLDIQNHDLEIRYRPGASNRVADALSRAPIVAALQLRDQEINDETFKTAQRADPDLALIIKFLEQPAEFDSSEQDFLEKRSKNYQLNADGILVFKQQTGHLERWVVPRSLQFFLLHHYHDLLGHVGMMKTRKALAAKYYWPGLPASVEYFVRSCVSCQTRNNPNPALTPPLQPIEAHHPFHTIALDLQELPLTRNGNKYVLVMIDMFTKWPEAVALPTRQAKGIARHFLNLIVFHFGAPYCILTDRAKDFQAEVQDILQLTGTKHLQSSGFAPQTNGLVERFNRTLQDLLSHYVDQDQANWDEHLDTALFAARVTVQATTGYSPFSWFMDVIQFFQWMQPSAIKSVVMWIRKTCLISNNFNGAFPQLGSRPRIKLNRINRNKWTC